MLKTAWAAKLALLGVMVLVLSGVLMRIGWLVEERAMRQQEAVSSVESSQAGAQTLLGPLLLRNCKEDWTVTDNLVARQESRLFTLVATPAKLSVTGSLQQEARYRGLFKVNAYAGPLKLRAEWTDLEALRAKPEHAGGKLQCGEVTAMLAAADPRGLRAAELRQGERLLAVRPGTHHPQYARGLHAELPGQSLTEPLHLDLAIDLLGSQHLALVPAAGATSVELQSNWAHPSFGGRFLPAQREVGPGGFKANWRVSELASSAAADVALGRPVAGLGGAPAQGAAAIGCTDTLDIEWLDPVSPYLMSDRALKYGLLFIVLTFASVALVELLARRRVHPVQYLLVGLALCVFYLLLLSLSEHLAFERAYMIASLAAAGLLTNYATAMLGHWRRGLAFGVGIGGLYGVLYLPLSREQTSLVIGAVMLFLLLAGVMVLTRRLDWYGLAGSQDMPHAPSRL